MPETRARTVPPQHDRRNYPIPAGWTVTFAPAEPDVPANGEMPVQVTIKAPAGFVGRQPFNVNVFDRAGFTGGVTLVVEAP